MVTFKVLSFRKNYEHENSEWAHYTAIVDLRSVPEKLEDWRKVNLRDPNLKGDVYSAIIGTIKNTPETFLRKNRGITILAAGFELNKTNDQLALDLVDDKLHGIIDGGHTFTAIKEGRNETTNGHVAMHIMTGITDLREVVDIVDARNRSRSAQSQSLDNLVGVYEPIKDALSSFSYANKISYSEYEVDDAKKRKPISVREILAYIYCLNPEDHTMSDDHPVAAYSGKGAVVDYFSPPPTDAIKGVPLNKGFADKVIKKAAPLLPSVLSFVDLLYKELPLAYNGEEKGDQGRFGALERLGVRKKVVQLHFGGVSATYDYPDAFLYPVLAAFRKKIRIKDGKWDWVKNPEEVWEDCKVDVGRRLRQIVDREKSINQLGKTPMNWTFLADAIK